jgi:Xaa-Pro aminopeptidase
MTRIKHLISVLSKERLDGILISNPTNVIYLTGVDYCEGYLLITRRDGVFFFSSPLYQYDAHRYENWKVILTPNNTFLTIAKIIKALGLKRVGFEAKYLPLLEYRKINQYLMAKHISFETTIDLIEKLRMIKDSKEIAAMRQAHAITKETLEYTSEIVRANMSEKELNIEIQHYMKLKADARLAFDPIVASGKNSASPHHISGSKKLNQNIVLIDLGARCYGYCADLTRVLFWGKMPVLFKRIYDIVKKAQELSIKKIRDGVTAASVDKAARSFIDKKGYGKQFIHGTGHGLGLKVHEPPYINATNETVLKEGMIVTIEPGIYINNKFGIRIEDMVLVTKKGAQVL